MKFFISTFSFVAIVIKKMISSSFGQFANIDNEDLLEKKERKGVEKWKREREVEGNRGGER